MVDKEPKSTHGWLTPRELQGRHYGLHKMKDHLVRILDRSNEVRIERHRSPKLTGHTKHSCVGTHSVAQAISTRPAKFPMNEGQSPPRRRVFRLLIPDRVHRCYPTSSVFDTDLPIDFSCNRNIDDVPDESSLSKRDQHPRSRRHLKERGLRSQSLRRSSCTGVRWQSWSALP